MQNILVIFIFFLFSCACQNNKQDEDYPPKKTHTTQQDKIHLNNADVKRKKKIDKEIKKLTGKSAHPAEKGRSLLLQRRSPAGEGFPFSCLGV